MILLRSLMWSDLNKYLKERKNSGRNRSRSNFSNREVWKPVELYSRHWVILMVEHNSIETIHMENNNRFCECTQTHTLLFMTFLKIQETLVCALFFFFFKFFVGCSSQSVNLSQYFNSRALETQHSNPKDEFEDIVV